MSAFIDNLAILTAVKTALDALKLPNGTDPLFELTKLYDATEVDRAFADLVVSRQKRVCLVIPGRNIYKRSLNGGTLCCEKRAHFGLLICDSDRKTGQEAMFGGANNVGVLTIQGIVIEALAGAQLAMKWVIIEPDEGDDFTVFDARNQSDPGRKGWFQLFETRAGIKNISISR